MKPLGRLPNPVTANQPHLPSPTTYLGTYLLAYGMPGIEYLIGIIQSLHDDTTEYNNGGRKDRGSFLIALLSHRRYGLPYPISILITHSLWRYLRPHTLGHRVSRDGDPLYYAPSWSLVLTESLLIKLPSPQARA